MNMLWKNSPMISFGCCLLGGVVLLLNGLDREDFYFCGLGLFFIGVAFFVGGMLSMAMEKRGTRPDDR